MTESLCACGHPWSRHTSGGMCTGDPPDGSECYCVLFPPEEKSPVTTDRLVTARVEVVQWMTPDGDLRWDIDYDEGTTLTQIVGMLALAQMEMYRRAMEAADV